MMAKKTPEGGVGAASNGDASVGQLGRGTSSEVGAGLPDANTAAPLSGPEYDTVVRFGLHEEPDA